MKLFIYFKIQQSRWPISEFPSQTCVLLLLSLHSVCHVTIAHCNDSNGTDTRVRVRCNDSDVTDRKQSRVCNNSTVTDMSWAIISCDILTDDKVRSENWMEPDCICANAIMCRTKKLMYLYRSNCDVQANISVAIPRIVTDKEIRVLLSQKLWQTEVAISTNVTDWLLLSLLLGRKIMYKCCYRYTVMDMSRRLRDGQLAETFYCSTYFFCNLLLTFYGFLFATLW